MKREILTWPHDSLRAICNPVAQASDVADLAEDMLETMYAAPGRGLSAPQIGLDQRVFVMDVAWKTGDPKPLVLINPVITWRSAEHVISEEGCLSIPGVTAHVTRNERIKVTCLDQSGAQHHHALDGFAARCAQHEIDHLDGTLTFDHLSEQERSDFLALYKAA